MNNIQTKNSALTTALAFHYQALIGIQKCFLLKDDQSVFIETEGDVTVAGADIGDSSQTEVKAYADALTDHHETFWKTLNNWLDSGFTHSKYGALILHTTQPFGSTTLFKDWNDATADGRIEILDQICSTRNFDTNTAPQNLSGVAKYQFEVMSQDKSILKAVVNKIYLHVEALDLDATRNILLRSLDGSIPKANQQAYLEALIGFIYEQASKIKWEITRASFINQRETLTAQYVRREFTVPQLTLRHATDNEVKEHSESSFVLKINEIEYGEVLPEAIGCWLELRNSLLKELDGFPKYRETAHTYR